MSRLAPRQAADGGFTLIELLLAMLVMGILLPAIAGTFYIALKTTDDTNRRLLDSHDIQSAAAFVSSDVQNAASFSRTDTTHCISGTYPVTSAVLYLAWTENFPDGSATDHSVNYYVSAGHLVRAGCINGILKSTGIMVNNLAPGTTPDIVCHPNADCTSNPVSLSLRGETVSGQFFSLVGTRRTS